MKRFELSEPGKDFLGRELTEDTLKGGVNVVVWTGVTGNRRDRLVEIIEDGELMAVIGMDKVSLVHVIEEKHPPKKYSLLELERIEKVLTDEYVRADLDLNHRKKLAVEDFRKEFGSINTVNKNNLSEYNAKWESCLAEDKDYQEAIVRYDRIYAASNKIKTYWDAAVKDFINTDIEHDK